MDAPMELIWDVVVKTALVLVLLYGVLWAIRRFNGRTGLVHRGPSILVVQSAQLGPGRSVHLIGVGDKVLLVGATAQQVSLLAELGAEDMDPVLGVQEVNDPFERYLHRAAQAATSLSSRLRGRGPAKGDGDETGAGAAE